MKAGRFITFEGGEGSGKSTQARLLTTFLQSRGLNVIATREPGGTPGAEAIRTLLLHPPAKTQWSPRAEALLFAAARAEHCDTVIRPALCRGEWVVCDRFVDSSFAYQSGADDITLDQLMALHEFGSHGLLPDCTVLLTAPRSVMEERLVGRGHGLDDAIEGRGQAFHVAVLDRFAALAAANPQRFLVVDGTKAPETVHQAVTAGLLARLPELA